MLHAGLIPHVRPLFNNLTSKQMLFLTKQRALLRANYKEIDMGKSSLAFEEVSVWEAINKNGKGNGFYNLINDKWFEQELKKGPDYRPGPVTVIKFDYLEQQ